MASPAELADVHVVAHVIDTYAEPWRGSGGGETDATDTLDWWNKAKPLTRRQIFEAWKGKRPPIGAVHSGGGGYYADVMDGSHYELKEGMALREDLEGDNYDLVGDSDAEKLAHPDNAHFWEDVPDTKSTWIEPTAEIVARCRAHMTNFDDECAAISNELNLFARFEHWANYFRHHPISISTEPDYVRRAVDALKQWDLLIRGPPGSIDAMAYAAGNPDIDFGAFEAQLYAIIDQGGFVGDARKTKQIPLDRFLAKAIVGDKRTREE